jgi:DNA-binding response OmpR family regulator
MRVSQKKVLLFPITLVLIITLSLWHITMKKKIFLIDDDRDLQHLLKLNLDKVGFNVEQYYTGYALIENTEDIPDVYILDIELPGINGLEICKWLKTHDATRDVPVIFLSAAPYLKTLAETVGADEYIEKPFDFPELVEKINNCLTADQIQA